jgi:hypothetical protein
MLVHQRIAAIAILGILPSISGASPSVERAASRFVPLVIWKPDSVVEGNFSCMGRRQRAILGTSKTEIVVAVFLNGLSNQPEILRYSGRVRNPESAKLSVESMDFDRKKYEKEVGPLPAALRPSKTCKGLNMSDQESVSTFVCEAYHVV